MGRGGPLREDDLMTDDIVQWLGAQLDEDERIARSCSGRDWREHPKNWVSTPPVNRVAVVLHDGDRGHILRHDPARVLLEIDAKRQLLAEVLSEPHFISADDHWNTCPAIVDEDGVPLCLDESRAPGPCDCGRGARVARRLHLLALPYADRPGYREEWRP